MIETHTTAGGGGCGFLSCLDHENRSLKTSCRFHANLSKESEHPAASHSPCFIRLPRPAKLFRAYWILSATVVNRRTMNFTTESFQGQRVVFANKQAFTEKLRQFKADGPNKLSVVSDFDFTISKFYMNGVRGASCHKIIEDCGLMAAEYHDEAQGLQAKYYPLEVDPTLNMEEKTKYMIEWVEKAHELLELHGLTKSVITRAVHSALETGKVGLRERTDAFFSLASTAKIPSLIFSAGIADVLEEILREQMAIDWSQVHVISNRCIFEESGDGKVTGFEQPLLHVFNKKSTAYLHTNFFNTEDIKDRSNLLLLGDSLGDISMSEGMDICDDRIIKVGFLNDRVERMDQYLEKYDLVILDDPGFDIPLYLLQEIVKQNEE